MAASPGVPSMSTPPASPFVGPATPPGPPPKLEVCRVCARESSNLLSIFSEAGKAQGLPNKVKQYLPVLVSSAIFIELTATPCLFCLKGSSNFNVCIISAACKPDLNEFFM